MAESAESKSIKQLTDTIIDENKKSRALQEKIAAGTRENGQFASRVEIDAAKESIKKQEESNIIQKKLLGVNDAVLEKIQNNAAAMDKQKEIMDVQRKELEDLGIDADQDNNFKKEQVKLAKTELEQAKLTGSKDAEKAAKDKMGNNKMLGYLKKTAGFLGGIAKQGMEKVKSGLQGFSKFAFGALAIAALSFLNSPQFDKYYDQIVNVIVPALTKLYDEVIKPLAIYIGGKLSKLFKDILAAIDGKKGLGELLLENWKTIGLIGLALAPAGLFGKVLSGTIGLTKLIAKGYNSKAVTGFMAKSGATVGKGLIFAGIALAIADGVAGWTKSQDWGVSKVKGAFGAALGGIEGGVKGMFKNAGKYALIGAGLGSIFPVIGTAIGGAVGALIGGILGYFGGENIAKAMQSAENMIAEAWESMKMAFYEAVLAFVPKSILGFLGIKGTTAEELNTEQKKSAETAEFRRDEKRLERKIKFAEKEVESTSRFLGMGTETKEKQEADRKKLESLQKELAARELEFKKQMGNTTVVDAKQITTDNSSSNMTTGSTSVRNSNPFISAYANSSDFSFG